MSLLPYKHTEGLRQLTEVSLMSLTQLHFFKFQLIKNIESCYTTLVVSMSQSQKVTDETMFIYLTLMFLKKLLFYMKVFI